MNPLLQPYLKSMSLDAEKRIVITVQPMLSSHLADEKMRKSAKDGLSQILGSNFKCLEMNSKGGRITVADGTAENSMALLEQKLIEGLSMAMQYMQNMQADK